MDKKKIAISGASGFIGTYLTSFFKDLNYEIVPITRKLLNNDDKKELTALLSGCHAVINLAGETINHIWTRSYKKKLYASRITTTRKIVNAINLSEQKPELFISGSAVGYYPSEGCYDEYSSLNGKGFLAQLCEQWEQEARKISPEVRLAITRFGVVLSPEGGALRKMVLPARFKIATVIGPGTQPFTWIDIKDLSKAMAFIINNSSLKGIINLVSPEQITYKEFTSKVAKYYNSWLKIKIPQLFFRTILGEASQFITQGQCVLPTKLLDSGFRYESSSINQFFSNMTNNKKAFSNSMKRQIYI